MTWNSHFIFMRACAMTRINEIQTKRRGEREKRMETKKKYGLFTAICMIVGIVIGSGIFFKSDNVLVATDGNVVLGIIVFVLAASAIVFGSLTIAELAMRSDGAGGIIVYAEKYVNERTARIFGWVQNFVYYPTITVVVSWVIGIYGCILFGIEATLELQIMIGFAVFTVLCIMNYLSAKMAGYFQNASTIIKIIPLFIVAIVGLIFGDPNFSVVEHTAAASQGVGWIAAVGPIAFSYDGWIIATNVSHEIKNEKKNLPKALVIAPVFILIIYVCYFLGISLMVGPEQIMQLGDAHVDVAFSSFMGPLGSKVLLVFVVISIMGTVNGLILGGSRGMYALGLKGMIPKSKTFAKIDQKRDMPCYGLILFYAFCAIWMVIHYLTMKFSLLNNSDVSEISIVTMYLLYLVLYIQVIRLKRQGVIKSVWKGYIIPILAMVGSLFVFVGGMQNPMFLAYVGFSAGVALIAGFYKGKKGIKS